MRRVAALPATRADPALQRLSKAANHSVLWLGVAAVLAVRKGATRRAGLRGVAAITGASFTANVVGKRVFPRRRRAAKLLPMHRRLAKRPRSSSFPSGHVASAAAFATAVTMESPRAGLAVAPVAAAVAYSRVHTGVHWPSDVAVGALVGVSAAFGTRHWWPLHPDVPGHSAHQAEAPVMQDGEDMVALVNPGSGNVAFDPIELALIAWPLATFVYPEDGADIREQLQRTIGERAARRRPVRALAVAGGDGTVAAVASVAAENHLPLALIPAGTLNHFARDVGVQSMAPTAPRRTAPRSASTSGRPRHTAGTQPTSAGSSTLRASAGTRRWCGCAPCCSAGTRSGWPASSPWPGSCVIPDRWT